MILTWRAGYSARVGKEVDKVLDQRKQRLGDVVRAGQLDHRACYGKGLEPVRAWLRERRPQVVPNLIQLWELCPRISGKPNCSQ
jgi:hypothetical protein